MGKMISEIKEQPAALERLLKGERRNIAGIADRIRKLDPAFLSLAARGSSDNAATFGKYLIECENGLTCSLAAPSVHTVYKKKIDMRRGVVIGVSQSGEGDDINETLRLARASGAYTVGITNTPGSAMAAVADDVILLRAGVEKGLAATKTYTCQLMAMMMLSASLAGDRALLAALDGVPDAVNETLAVESRVREITERYRYMERCVIIGRGFNYATVKEAALKLMETSYVVAQPFSTADFMHGPIAMTGAGFPAFVCAPSGRMAAPIRKLCGELRDKQLETVIASSNPATLKLASKAIRMPVDCGELVSPILYIVPFQFFANFLSVARGLDPDNPRFLKKVTKTL
ncbi:MAG: Glutamine--fructose-6-phosphate aminotransferase (isomerizing) [bacterium ADurb.Bin236]|nr:MAG: Glutamine--fructose-6-phosphate aminotransferase (isomerizing) [bacterium ADurb.Bin236]HPN94773.1 SIS domain-containing protein [bacterium]